MLVLLGSLGTASLLAQQKDYHDGPYIDHLGDSLRIRWIEQGVAKDTSLVAATAQRFERPGLPSVDLSDLRIPLETEWKFFDAPTLLALSDLHGQFDIFLRLLLANGVIDAQRNWQFGQNHLIITGDHFSRGDQVMDILWLLFQLEKQASLAGGKVHVLLGNHELMTLNNDLRYLNRKYAYTAGGFRQMYPDLFGPHSILGQWLRQKPVIVAVNDILFVHGGLSPTMMQAGMEPEQINAYFRQTILPSAAAALSEDPTTDLLLGGQGPLWYRGYVDSLQCNADSIQAVLDFYNVNHIVVGHSSMPEILSRFNNKLFFIDCSIKLGESGEALIWEKNNFYRARIDGSREAFSQEADSKPISLFEALLEKVSSGQQLQLNLQCDARKLINQSSREEYQDINFVLLENGQPSLQLPARVRARGNMRKVVCPLPPLKFDFKKKTLKALGLSAGDKLKLVMPCRSGKKDQEKLLQEYFIYGLYALLEPAHIKALPLAITILDPKGKTLYDFQGFVVEDEVAYAHRTGAYAIGEKGVIRSAALERTAFVKMLFFQYMIGNTDWSVPNRHNVLLVRLPGNERCTAIPYDFDYAGFVSQSYAIPYETLPIKSVRERYFMPYAIAEQELEAVIAFYRSQQSAILAYCDQATYLAPKTIEASKQYLQEFFDALEKPERLRRSLEMQ